MDIDFLKRIGQVDSFPVSVDSSKRDTRVFPRPAEYEIHFDPPFTNVVGFDILDATIPNTMYSVDYHNNLLSFAVRVDASPKPPKSVDGYLDDLSASPAFAAVWGDTRYSLLRLKISDDIAASQLDRAVTATLEGGQTVSTHESLRIFVSELAAAKGLSDDDALYGYAQEALRDGSDIHGIRLRHANEQEVSPDWPAVVLHNEIALSFSDDRAIAAAGIKAIPVDTGTSYRITYDNVSGEYFIEELSGSAFGPGVHRAATFGTGGGMFAVSAIDGRGTVRYASVPATALWTSTVAEGGHSHLPVFEGDRLVRLLTYGVYRVSNEFYNGMTNAKKTDDYMENPFGLPDTTFHHEIHFHNLLLDVGNHAPNTIVKAIEFAMPTYVPNGAEAGSAEQPVLSLYSTSLISDANNPDFSRQKRIRFESDLPFWMDMEKSTIRNVIGFGGIADDRASGYSTYRIGDNLRVFRSVGKAGSSRNVLETPGVMSLIGERMVVLRCPQIEEHAFPSRGRGGFSAGLGVFKLYEQTIAHLRFDFTKLKRLDFHPIGKLQKLRFRFERLNGDLYDFKGVEHHLFMVVKYMIPRNDRTIPPPHRRLNPDYDPDVMRYQAAQREARDSDTGSDRDIMSDPRRIEIYNENMRRFKEREEAALSGPYGFSGSGSGSDSYDGSGSDSYDGSGSDSYDGSGSGSGGDDDGDGGSGA